MRNGFTTGSCAALCAKAATYMLLSGEKIENMEIMTPGGVKYSASLYNIDTGNDYVSCGVYKDSGDDPDVTAGMFIGVKVSKNSFPHETDGLRVNIFAGEGIGTVTRKGLEQPVGSPAINSVPRKMIIKEVEEICSSFFFEGEISVTVFAPKGREIAEKTFNPHMGIEGGISILGTTGIVEPMSTKAVIDTIKWDLSVKLAEGMDRAVIVPGKYGVNFLTNNYGYSEKNIVTCSNFIGDALILARNMGFKEILFCGHIGKLIKVYGGEMYTHSSAVDRRMELMEKAANKPCGTYSDCVTTTAVLDILNQEGRVRGVSEEILNGVLYHMNKLVNDESVKIYCILYESKYGLLSTNYELQ